MSLVRPKNGRKFRRGWPIHAYIGPNGGGKTLAAVWDSMPSLMRGRPVLSTVRLLDFENPRACDDALCTHAEHEMGVEVTHRAAHPLWIPWTRWSQLLEVEKCDVIADEITGVASSRESQSMPAMVANALVQLRRADVTFRWTAPSWARADLIVRECSQAATVCKGYLPVAVPADDEDDERAWRHRRLFHWVTYDAVDLDDLTAGKAEGLKPWTVDYHWGPGSDAFEAYDTFDAVSTIGHVSDAGRCMTCGGRRRAEPCTCPDHGSARGRTGGAAPARGPRLRGASGAGHQDVTDDTYEHATVHLDGAANLHGRTDKNETVQVAIPAPSQTPDIESLSGRTSDASRRQTTQVTS